MTAERKCRQCGCTDSNACVTAEGACHWVAPDLCSACFPDFRLYMEGTFEGIELFPLESLT